MKNIFLGSLVVLILTVVGYSLFTTRYVDTEKQTEEVLTGIPPIPSVPSIPPVVEAKEYRLESEGLSFTYEDGLEGYYLEDRDTSQALEPTLVRDIILTPTADYEDQKNRVGGEGTPSWQVAVYTNDEMQSPEVWMDANPTASNGELAIESPREEMVGGVPAVRYTIDGPYRTEMVVIAYGSFMFVVSGSYLDENSPTYQDFSAWLNSFVFFEQEAMGEAGTPQGKIEVRVACESALTYMTFLSGEEAETFVTECVDGKHPEVIDRYISDLGVDGAVI
jgi:hypothetical protein